MSDIEVPIRHAYDKIVDAKSNIFLYYWNIEAKSLNLTMIFSGLFFFQTLLKDSKFEIQILCQI